MEKSMLVMGMGLSGIHTQAYLEKRGVTVYQYDDKKEIDPHKRFIDLERTPIEKVVVSPGIPLDHPLLTLLSQKGIPFIHEMSLVLDTYRGKVVAITGTNGKTTTTKLIEWVLKKGGLSARAVGNIGIPLTSIEAQEDILVIEVSSYQLDLLTQPYFDFGLILNITPDHLDRYKTYEAYHRSKWRLLELMKNKERLFCSQHIPAIPLAFEGSYYEGSLSPAEIQSPYRIHSNIEAAFSIAQAMGIPKAHFLEALKDFQPPEHRIEFIESIDGVEYYNDSKATNVESVQVALESFENPIVLIMGGLDKDLDFSSLRPLIQKKVKHLLLIGKAKKKLQQEFQDLIHLTLCETLLETVQYGHEIASTGDVVLLAPGCASFDMFQNYEDRGCQFKALVRKLKEKGDL